jgi:tetratricopeptide (TPR) repeat protein
MSENLQFRFSVDTPPEGEAVTGEEIEKRCLKQLHEKGGTCLQSLWNLAYLYSKTGRHEEALRCIQRLIALSEDPEAHGAYHLALGQLMEKARDFRAAVGYYRQALALEPCQQHTWYFIHNNLGYSLNQLGNYEAAMPYLQRAIEIDPGRPNAYKNLGLAHQARGDFEEAATLFVAATQVNASDSRSLAHLEELVSAHPELEVDMPELRDQMEACRGAVDFAKAQQPDLDALWAKARQAQRRKWWQFWKRPAA